MYFRRRTHLSLYIIKRNFSSKNEHFNHYFFIKFYTTDYFSMKLDRSPFSNVVKLRNTHTFPNSAYLDRFERVLKVLRLLTYPDKVWTI